MTKKIVYKGFDNFDVIFNARPATAEEIAVLGDNWHIQILDSTENKHSITMDLIYNPSTATIEQVVRALEDVMDFLKRLNDEYGEAMTDMILTTMSINN